MRLLDKILDLIRRESKRFGDDRHLLRIRHHLTRCKEFRALDGFRSQCGRSG